MRAIVIMSVTAIGVVAPFGTLGAQISPFKVVAIKQNISGATSGGVELRPGGRLVITNTPVRDVIRYVFNLPEFAVTGGPDWLASERYDIVAEAEGEPTREQWMQTMRVLLADRFKLRVRLDARELPIYELVLASVDRRLGPQLTSTTVDCAAAERQQGPIRCGVDLQGDSIKVVGRPMSRLVRTLAQLCGRQVIDRTGLDGLYDAAITWKPDVSADANCASLSAALEEQLALKLQSARDQAEVLVINISYHRLLIPCISSELSF
jgi:uncharacterized protein (TIGR03435 family)